MAAHHSLTLLFLVSLLSCILAQSSWAGTWTSHYSEPPSSAEKFYICVDDNLKLLEGMYSQVGFISGSYVVNSDGTQDFTGTYYEAGREGPLFQNGTGKSTKPAWGYIKLKLASDGQSFSGSWAYSTSPNPSGSPDGTWAETRLSSEAPTSYQCFSRIGDASAAQTTNAEWSGVLGGGYADICITQSPSMGSYEQSSSGVSVFMYGQCFLEGTLCQYNYATDEDVAGIMLTRSAFKKLWWVQWEYPTIDDWTYTLGALAPLTNWSFNSPLPNGCARNLYLQSGLRGSASAAALSVTLVILATILVFM